MADQTEAEQIEKLKNWWIDNGIAIIAGIVVTLFSIFGWRAWQAHLTVKSQEASELYQQMLIEFNDKENVAQNEDIKNISNQLLNDYKSTSYAVFASLLMASKAVEQDDIENAQKYLRWALENAKNDEILHIIRLRLARLLLSEHDQDGALALLDDIQLDTGRFASAYLELRGDIFADRDDSETAEKFYRKALTTQGYDIQLDQSALQMKLDDLAR